MSKIYNFIKDCSVFFLLTINEDFPSGRPFGAIMEIGNDLYISTSAEKEVYKQLKKNTNVQIIALKSGTRNWLRVNGMARECNDFNIKRKMLEACPTLKRSIFPMKGHIVIAYFR